MSAKSVLGCLIGTAVGDALGLPYEGLSKRRSAKLFGPPDRHRFLLGHGMISDDTEHTCMVAQSLIQSGGDPDKFVQQMSRRLRCWIIVLPAGVGLATAKACFRLLVGFPPESAGVFSAGNGPAMRSALLGVCVDDTEVLQQLVSLNTRITHNDPKAEFGAVSIALAARLAQQDRNIQPSEYLSRLQEHLQGRDAGEYLKLVDRAVQSVEQKQSTFEFAEQEGLSGGVGGYVYHCIPVVLHCWLSHQSDYRKAVMTIIQCGGDTDTNAAMVGGIVGTKVGLEGIPHEWIEGISEWPMSVQWMTGLVEQLSEAMQSGTPEKPKSAFWGFVLLRNLFFLAIVLLHGFRRTLPPY